MLDDEIAAPSCPLLSSQAAIDKVMCASFVLWTASNPACVPAARNRGVLIGPAQNNTGAIEMMPCRAGRDQGCNRERQMAAYDNLWEAYESFILQSCHNKIDSVPENW